MQEVKQEESRVTVGVYATPWEFEPKHVNLQALKNAILKKEKIVQVLNCIRIFNAVSLSIYWASLSSALVSRADVSIGGVQGAPVWQNGYKGYAIYLEHGKLMPLLLSYNQFLHTNLCNILEIKIQR